MDEVLGDPMQMPQTLTYGAGYFPIREQVYRLVFNYNNQIIV